MTDYLQHYGVKGQKWGVRKETVKSAATKVGKTAKKAATSDFAKKTAFSTAGAIAGIGAKTAVIALTGNVAAANVASIAARSAVSYGGQAVAKALQEKGSVNVSSIALQTSGATATKILTDKGVKQLERAITKHKGFDFD